MEEDKMETMVIDYLEGNLSGELKNHVEKKIEKDVVWKSTFDRLQVMYDLLEQQEVFIPPASIREQFESALTQEIENTRATETKTGSAYPWFGLAAGFILTVMLSVIVYLLIQNRQQQQDMQALRGEIDENRALVLDAMTNQKSASSRLVGVNTSSELKNIDSELEDALFKAFLSDENSNVRLAALNALSRFADEATVRDRLLASLDAQTDPLAMIQLINVLVRLEEHKALPTLKKILESEEYQQVIREEAQIGITKLS